MDQAPKNLEEIIPPWMDWRKEDSEELVMMYLEDYYLTLDDYFLEEAIQIAREDGVDIEKLMRKVRFQQS